MVEVQIPLTTAKAIADLLKVYPDAYDLIEKLALFQKNKPLQFKMYAAILSKVE
jgi:hypothetical protein